MTVNCPVCGAECGCDPGVFNFMLNRCWVFCADPKPRSGMGFSAASRVIPWLVIFGASTGIVWLASLWIPCHLLPHAKGGIDILLSLVLSYPIQKLLVFRSLWPGRQRSPHDR